MSLARSSVSRAVISFVVEAIERRTSGLVAHATVPVETSITIAERAYLGEFWDYAVASGNGPKLRVTAPPLEIYQVGETAWLAFDPKQMTPIR